jgi:hypothetical protein
MLSLTGFTALLPLAGCSSADGSGWDTQGASADGGSPVASGDSGAPKDGGADHTEAGGCTSDVDCNGGSTGTGLVCSTSGSTAGRCISGCHHDSDCPSGDVCDQSATPHWACAPADAGGGGTADAGSSGVSGSAIAALALANVGQGACTANTLGGSAFDSSCTGNGGQPEYWCADFAMWVWSSAGITDMSGLTAAAGSFYVYGQNNGTLSNTPAVGDAAVFGYQGSGVANHVAIVTQVNADGTIETVSGDWNGQSGTEAQFASTSSVVLNSPAYDATVGSSPAIMGMTISGFIAPVGVQ